MLQDIYAWFSSNMKGRTMSFHESSSRPQEMPPELAFSLHSGSHESYDHAPICDNASFNSEWFEDSNKPVFKCNCQLQKTMHGDIHDEELSQYFGASLIYIYSSYIYLMFRLVSPIGLIVRLNGLTQSWKIWLSSGITSRVISLIMRNITPSSMQRFIS